MEQRRQVLELPPAGALLEHPAAVDADAARRAVVVGVEQGAHAAEPRRLDVEHAWWPGQRLDVGDRVDRLVPGDPVAVGLEQALRPVLERRILDPRTGQPLDDAPVQAVLGRHRHGEVAVGALEVDDIDAAQLRELRDDAVVPAGRGVQLEAQPGVLAQPRPERAQVGRVPDADRRHEGHRPGLPTDGVLQREAVLAQGQVERRAFERPPAVEAGAVADGVDGEEVGQGEQVRKLVERTGPVQPAQVTATAQELDLVDLVPGDVLALADVRAAAETHDDRHLGEPARRVADDGVQLAAVDDERQRGDARVGRGGLICRHVRPMLIAYGGVSLLGGEALAIGLGGGHGAGYRAARRPRRDPRRSHGRSAWRRVSARLPPNPTVAPATSVPPASASTARVSSPAPLSVVRDVAGEAAGSVVCRTGTPTEPTSTCSAGRADATVGRARAAAVVAATAMERMDMRGLREGVVGFMRAGSRSGRGRTWGRFLILGVRHAPLGRHHESQIGPKAGMPTRSRPWTTCQVPALLLTTNTASAPNARHASWARRSRSGLPRAVVSQISASGWAPRTSSTNASP